MNGIVDKRSLEQQFHKSLLCKNSGAKKPSTRSYLTAGWQAYKIWVNFKI